MARQKRQPSMAADIIGKLAGKLGAGFNPTLLKLQNGWAGIVGGNVADHSEPVRVARKTLTVRVDHPAWMHELTFLKPQMLQRIAACLSSGLVNDIRFELGSVSAAASAMSRHKAIPTRPLSPDEEEFIEQAAGEIEDDEVRNAALLAMRKSFGSRRKT